jgi:hypothetical protein
MELVLADPTKVETIKAFGQEFPLAMDLEAWLDQVEATGPPAVAGVRQMLRPDKFEGRSRLTFLQPFDPDKIPVVLVHGLMSTPRMWKPVLDGPWLMGRFASTTTRPGSLFRFLLCSFAKC